MTQIPGPLLALLLHLGTGVYKNKFDHLIDLDQSLHNFLTGCVQVADLEAETKEYYLNELEPNHASDTSPPNE